MQNNKIQKIIEGEFEMLEESIKYHLESLCVTLGNLNTLRFLMFLKEDNDSQENN